jgi:hypothetical protein
MRITDGVIFDGAEAKALRGVISGLLQPAIVEAKRLGLTVFEKQLAIVSPLQSAHQLAANLDRGRDWRGRSGRWWLGWSCRLQCQRCGPGDRRGTASFNV